MREIEFRAWDTAIHKDGVMIAWEELKKYSCESVFLPLREVELMQYIGEKDESGIKLFVGDIVKAKTAEKDGILVIEHVSHMTYTGFMFYGRDRRFSVKITRSTMANLQVKRIGNKFENPELMETKC